MLRASAPLPSPSLGVLKRDAYFGVIGPTAGWTGLWLRLRAEDSLIVCAVLSGVDSLVVWTGAVMSGVAACTLFAGVSFPCAPVPMPFPPFWMPLARVPATPL